MKEKRWSLGSREEPDETSSPAHIPTQERFFLYLLSGLITVGDFEQFFSLSDEYFNFCDAGKDADETGSA